jgi:hypothetical protein
MPTLARVFQAISLLCVMAGCEEHQYGIRRHAVLAAFPDVACMRRCIDQVTEIQRIQDIEPPADIELHEFRYEGEGFWAHLSVGETGGKILLLHERLTIDKKPSEAELKETHRVMLLVEQRLVAQCGMKELATGVHEEWVEVKRPE